MVGTGFPRTHSSAAGDLTWALAYAPAAPLRTRKRPGTRYAAGLFPVRPRENGSGQVAARWQTEAILAETDPGITVADVLGKRDGARVGEPAGSARIQLKSP